MSIVKKIGMHIHPIPLRDQILRARSRLAVQKERLESMAIKIQHKDQELFERCIGAQASKDLSYAQLYANECAQVRKVAHIVLSSQLALEQVIFKLDMALELGELAADMRPIVGVVAETRTRISNIVPHIAAELEEINTMLSDLSEEAGPVLDNTANVDVTTEDAKKVLEESSAIAQERLSQTFPKLPELTIEQSHTDSSILPGRRHNAGVESRVYEYIKAHQGNLHVPDAARILEIAPDRVKEALERLASEGKIVVE